MKKITRKVNGSLADLSMLADQFSAHMFENQPNAYRRFTVSKFDALSVLTELGIPSSIHKKLILYLSKECAWKVVDVPTLFKDKLTEQSFANLLSMPDITDDSLQECTNEKDVLRKLRKIFFVSDEPLIEVMDSSAETFDIESDEYEDNVVYADNLSADNADLIQNYFNSLNVTKLLSFEEEKLLSARIKKGDKNAIKELMEANLRLVISIAKKYKNNGISLIDLIHDGNIGLYKAVIKFDSTKGFRFSTYAHWWVQQAITRSIAEKSSTIRMPVHLFELRNKINKFTNNYAWNNGFMPTDAELTNHFKISLKKLKNVMQLKNNCISIDQSYGLDDNHNLSEILPDSNNKSPYENLIKRESWEHMKELINKLPEREARIIKLRFNIEGDDTKLKGYSKKKTLDCIGKIIKVTRERIRQLEINAIDKLRKSVNIDDILPVDLNAL